jgi:tRNA-specific 2-thiouridylase
MSKKVFVGLSGGVDSSVAAALLVEQGYEVVGVYMKNWSKDLPGFPCPWKEDYQDAKRVAVQLGIEFRMFDFEKEYFEKVVDYMLDGFRSGITPNPDIMCNQEIKFKLFLDVALEQGADMIATGHYAKVIAKSQTKTDTNSEITKTSDQRVKPLTDGENVISYLLGVAKDDNKDQTYFLYRIAEAALSKTLFPLGDYTKPEVRELAKKFGLVTAAKKESMGICFVGKVGIKEFLQQYVETTPGPIIDDKGKIIGEHDGAIFYTTGQRHGLNVGGGLPYYVVGKDMDKNEVYVTADIDDSRLWSKDFVINSAHWINDAPQNTNDLKVRTRHRATPLSVVAIMKLDNGNWHISLDEEVRALTAGQSAVFYQEGVCLGGGIII